MNLPEKCCANCGFLYGRAFDPATREDAFFDPDLLRDEEYPPSYDGKPGFVTSRAYAIQRYFERVHDQTPRLIRVVREPEPLQVRSYCWRDTAAVYCYLKQFKPITVKHKPVGGLTIQQEIEVFEHQISPSWFNEIKHTIRKDRQNCGGFFQYHPGYSVSEHAKLKVEEDRIERAEKHERRLTEWSILQEQRLIKWSDAQEGRWQRFQAEREKEYRETEDEWKKRELRLVIIFGVLGLLFTGLQILASYLIAYYFPLGP